MKSWWAGIKAGAPSEPWVWVLVQGVTEKAQALIQKGGWAEVQVVVEALMLHYGGVWAGVQTEEALKEAQWEVGREEVLVEAPWALTIMEVSVEALWDLVIIEVAVQAL